MTTSGGSGKGQELSGAAAQRAGLKMAAETEEPYKARARARKPQLPYKKVKKVQACPPLTLRVTLCDVKEQS